MLSDDPSWWRSAVIYQVYIRSFADGSGDGVGDIAGIRSRLPYLAGLGVDALWINPWYPSPMADGGYDVSDYRAVEPVFGSLDEATALIREAHGHGLRVLLDLVPNHTSDQHAWFQAALASPVGSPERARYLFRDGRGADGAQPPNDWRSVFGGPAWHRESPTGQWFLHLFAPEQPDLDWTNDEVRADVEQTLRFWFDRDVDGFRIDVAHGLIKADGLPDLGDRADPTTSPRAADHPHWDRDAVHEIYRAWRNVADSYDPPRVFVAEAWVTNPERLAAYVRPDELHTAFNFDFLRAPWLAPALRRTIDATLRDHAAVGAPATWVLSNHDVARHVSRYARPQSDRPLHSLQDLVGVPGDLELGRRRGAAAALLMLALPGGAYVYQGEELGLEEVEDLPDEVLADPTWERSEHTDRGRDGCRVPLPWAGDAPPFGFGASAWLPQPAGWAARTPQAQAGVEGSFLALYRSALTLRRDHPALGDGDLHWLPSDRQVLLFRRSPGFGCLANLGVDPVVVPTGARVLLSSAPLVKGLLPADATAWLELAD